MAYRFLLPSREPRLSSLSGLWLVSSQHFGSETAKEDLFTCLLPLGKKIVLNSSDLLSSLGFKQLNPFQPAKARSEVDLIAVALKGS